MAKVVTPSVLAATFVGFKANFQRGFAGVAPVYTQIATTVPSTHREETYGWLGDIPKLREWIGDRHVRSLEAHGYSIKNRKFEATIGVKSDDIADDAEGIYAPRFEMLGQSAAKHPDELVFEAVRGGFATLCYDGQNFFDSDHPVAGSTVSNVQSGAGEPWVLADLSRPLKPFIFQKREDYTLVAREDARTSDRVFMADEFLYGVKGRAAVGYGFWQMAFGSRATLDATNLRAAYTAMTGYTDDEGRPLGVKPTHIIVGSQNHFAARDILLAETLSGGGSNTNRNLVQIIEAPLLHA